MGMVPVPPADSIGSKDLQTLMSFKVELNGTTYYGLYMSNPVTINTPIQRNNLYYLTADWAEAVIQGNGYGMSAEQYTANISTSLGGRVILTSGEFYLFDNSGNRNARVPVLENY